MGGKYTPSELYDLLVSCSLYLTLNSVLILMISALFLGGGPFAAGLGIVTGTSLMTLVYIVDRLDVSEEDRINNPSRTALVERYYNELLATVVATSVVFELSLFLTVFSPTATGVGRVLLAHVPVLMLILYDSIKTVSLPLDSVAVAFTWGYELVFIFVFISPLTVEPLDGILLFLSWFLIVFAGLEARNAKDIEGDEATGKVTLAVIFGVQRTKYVELALKGIGALLLVTLSQSLLVLALVALHIGSLWFYSTLETDFRCDSTATDLESA